MRFGMKIGIGSGGFSISAGGTGKPAARYVARNAARSRSRLALRSAARRARRSENGSTMRGK
jgi:hypothetical protein